MTTNDIITFCCLKQRWQICANVCPRMSDQRGLLQRWSLWCHNNWPQQMSPDLSWPILRFRLFITIWQVFRSSQVQSVGVVEVSYQGVNLFQEFPGRPWQPHWWVERGPLHPCSESGHNCVACAALQTDRSPGLYCLVNTPLASQPPTAWRRATQAFSPSDKPKSSVFAVYCNSGKKKRFAPPMLAIGHHCVRGGSKDCLNCTQMHT